jgi:hypothetical protein
MRKAIHYVYGCFKEATLKIKRQADMKRSVLFLVKGL